MCVCVCLYIYIMYDTCMFLLSHKISTYVYYLSLCVCFECHVSTTLVFQSMLAHGQGRHFGQLEVASDHVPIEGVQGGPVAWKSV